MELQFFHREKLVPPRYPVCELGFAFFSDRRRANRVFETPGLRHCHGPMIPAIITHQLTRRFGSFCAVDDLDLTVETGMFYGFLGPNGAGKSTTIKMLTGLLEPTRGSVRILGADISHPHRALEVKRRLGVVPANLALFDNLTARNTSRSSGECTASQRILWKSAAKNSSL